VAEALTKQAPSVVRWRPPPITLSAQELEVLQSRLDQRLAQIAAEHQPVWLACSFSAEDMILVERIASRRLAIRVFFLDTGRLHQATLDFAAQVALRYGVCLHPVEARLDEIAALSNRQHDDDIFHSETARKACCEFRKVRPMNRALAHAMAWITGLRREQSPTRESLAYQETDLPRAMPKFSPLFDWSLNDVWSYTRHYALPVHPLHERGYASIGCEPCTRAIRVGEDLRAGRWWWLNAQAKECGLHQGASWPACPQLLQTPRSKNLRSHP